MAQEQEQKQKRCGCPKPLIVQALPEGFQGTVICARCQGIAKVTTERKPKYEGPDAIAAFLASRNDMTVESAMLTLMYRIEQHLAKMVEQGDKQRK